MSDTLEEQGLEKVIACYRGRKGVERDLLNQLNLYEAMLRHEDGIADSTAELTSHMDNIRSSVTLTTSLCRYLSVCFSVHSSHGRHCCVVVFSIVVFA